MTNAAAKFLLHIAPVKPGDFGPSGYAVYSDVDGIAVESVVIRDGDVVEALGDVRTETEGSYDDKYEVAHRKVRTSSGFVGTVCWHDFDGRSGFEAV